MIVIGQVGDRFLNNHYQQQSYFVSECYSSNYFFGWAAFHWINLYVKVIFKLNKNLYNVEKETIDLGTIKDWLIYSHNIHFMNRK
jgi:hypothetical protein